MTREIFVIYCDDVRFEATGKRIYIGVYDGALIANSLPILLPTLSVICHVSTAIDDPFKKLVFDVQKDGTTVASTTVEADPELIPHLPSANKMMATAILQISQLMIEKEGHLQVVVTTEKEKLESQKLRLMAASSVQESAAVSR